MCGISGIYNYNSEPVSLEAITKTSRALNHRGPDDFGYWLDGNIGFAHQRLSIIDTSNAGHQPMHSSDGNYTIVFNGEIYNHDEFRDELKAKGFVFHSSSDTEVLLNLFIAYGHNMLNRLNGMFAFAIWNKAKQELFVCRDRVGVKPLYYYHDQKTFRFASEPKAIFASGIKAQVNTENINEWLMYRFTSGEETLLTNIKKLLPGHYTYIKKDGQINPIQWWNLKTQIENHPIIKSPLEWFEETFHSSVKYRMVADVPVGILLSGGLDSSSVAASLKLNNYNGIETFNVGFHDYVNDESAIAKKYSSDIGFNFNGIHVEKHDLYQAVVNSTISYDEPLVHMNDPQIYALANHAKKKVKVLLSGEGADEFLGGYVRYKTFKYINYKSYIKTILKLTPERFKTTRIHKLERYLEFGGINQLTLANASNYFETDFNKIGLQYMGMSNPYRAKILAEAKQLYPKEPERQLLYFDQHTYLQSLNDRNDRATMGASIECREPFQDYRLMEGLGSLETKYLLSGSKGKYLLKTTMKKYLPEYILGHKKVGFSVPWKNLINNSEELNSAYQEFLESDIFELVGLNKSSKNTLIQYSQDKNNLFDQLLLQLFFMYIWKKHYLNQYQ
jgi:asparagine synthase (glutamine-hydrolysing)